MENDDDSMRCTLVENDDDSMRCIQILAVARVNYLSDNIKKIKYIPHIQNEQNIDHQKLLLNQRSKAIAMELIMRPHEG